MKLNLPNKITISRIVMTSIYILAIFILYFVDKYTGFLANCNILLNRDWATVNWVMIILFVVFVIICLTDFLDGFIARRTKQVTDLGKFLDPIADKMLINATMIFLAINFVSLSDNLTYPFFCVVLMIIRDLVVDGMRLVAAKKNIVVSANIFGKLKTVLQIVSICLVLLNGWPFNLFDASWGDYYHITDIICYITTIVSITSGVLYIVQNKQVFLGGEKK